MSEENAAEQEVRVEKWKIFGITLNKLNWITIFAGLFVFVAWGLTLILLWQDGDKKLGDVGKFGDMFGAVNALFSGLAFIGIIITILMQSQELELQRQELKGTRQEFKIQNETMTKQRFENTFFQMLSLHHEIVDKLKKGNSVNREVLTKASDTLHAQLVDANNSELSILVARNNGRAVTYGPEESFNVLKSTYVSFYQEREANLSHYYRNLYHILKFIYQSKFINADEKKFYSSLVRSQLSHGELHLIFYNSMTDGLGNPKFLFLVKEFDLMQNFGRHQINLLNHHEQIFTTLTSQVTSDVLNQYNPTPVSIT